jgi:hypothetical protein
MMVAQPVIEKNRIANQRHVLLRRTSSNSDNRLHSRFARERNNGMQVIRHKQTKAECQTNRSSLNFMAARTASLVCAGRVGFPGGTQLMVIKNQLASATRCRIV